MKKILITVIVFFLAGILFFAQNRVNSNLSEKTEQEINDIISKNDLPINIGNISVNSISTSVKFSDVSINESGVNLYISDIVLNIPYKEIISILNNQSLEKIKSFDVEFKNVIINAPKEDFFNHKLASNISISYNGVLTKEMVQNLNLRLPEANQKIKVELEDFKIPDQNLNDFFAELKLNPINPEMLKSDIGCTLEYIPGQRQINITNVYQKNSFGKSNFNAKLKYQGNNIENMTLSKIDIDGDSDINLNSLSIGNYNTATVIMNRFSSNFQATINGNIENMREEDIAKNIKGDYTISFNNLYLKLSDKIINEIKKDIPFALIIPNEIIFKNMGMDVKWDGKRFQNNIDIKSTLAAIDSDIDIAINMQRPDKSRINKCTLKIGDLNNDLKTLIETLENMGGKKLPRQGNAIFLNVTGTLDDPKIKGLF